MKTRFAAIASAAVLAVLLTGCGSDATSEDAQPRAFAQGVEATESPLTAEPTTEPLADASIESKYLEHLRRALEGSGGSSIPNATDQQLVDAGHSACVQLEEGKTYDQVRVVDGEPNTEVGYKDSNRIAAAAAMYFCTEYDLGS